METPFTERDVTPEEARNGWTRETLTRYFAEREQQRLAFAAEQMRRPLRAAGAQTTRQFDPHNW